MSEAPVGMIPVADFAKLKEIAPSKVIEMIRDGFYAGRKVGQEWFVDSSELDSSDCEPTKESNHNALGLGTLSQLILGSFCLFFALIFVYRAVDPQNIKPESGYLDYVGVVFFLVISAACFLPSRIAGYFGDIIAICVIGLAIWYLIVALPNPEPGQDPIAFAGIFGGLAVLHLFKRYNYVFAAKDS